MTDRRIVQDFPCALAFTTNQKVDFDNSFITADTEIFAFSFTTKYGDQNSILFGNSPNNATNGFSVRLWTAPNMYLYHAGTSAQAGAGIKKYYNQWVKFFGVIKKGDYIRLYLNGVLVSETTGITSYSLANNSLGIGDRGSNDFQGKVSDLKVWTDQEFTHAEVMDEYLTGGSYLYRNNLQIECGKGEPSQSAWEDTSGNENNGTITGATLTNDVPLQRRKLVDDGVYALSFVNQTDTVAIPTSPELQFNNDLITVQVKFKPTVQIDTEQIIGAGTSILIRQRNDKKYEFILNSFSANDRIEGGIVVPGKETEIIGTFDGTDIKIYQDSYLVGSITPTGTYTSGVTDWFISTVGSEDFLGNVSLVRIWKGTALTGLEARDLYFENKVPRENLVAEYLFNEGTGTTLSDSSGNGNDGTITGATWVSKS